MAKHEARIGEISSGTLRTPDLLEAFADELRRLSDAPAHVKLCDEVDAMLERMDDGEDDKERDRDDEEASAIVDELMDALNEIAPPYCYFGASEGDGACFGFWPSMESLREAVYDGSVLQVDDTGDMPADYEGEVMHVNDHGNVTLYVASGGKLSEVWAIV